VLHFPIRSPEQCVRKWDNCREHYRDALPFVYDSLLVDDDVLADGLSQGSLVEDSRLRDVLRALRSSRGEKRSSRGLRLPQGDPPLELPAHTLLDDAALAADVTAASERDSFVRAQRRLDELETRLSYLERRPASRVAHAARRVALAALRR
jgi:hypothetical protein